jgi:hypothetical protein
MPRSAFKQTNVRLKNNEKCNFRISQRYERLMFIGAFYIGIGITEILNQVLILHTIFIHMSDSVYTLVCYVKNQRLFIFRAAQKQLTCSLGFY